MSNLKAQLLKSGLVDNKRAKKIHQQQLEAGKAAKDEAKNQVQQAMAEKAEKDRLLNLQLKEEQEKKAISHIHYVNNLYRLFRVRSEVPPLLVRGGKRQTQMRKI